MDTPTRPADNSEALTCALKEETSGMGDVGGKRAPQARPTGRAKREPQNDGAARADRTCTMLLSDSMTMLKPSIS